MQMDKTILCNIQLVNWYGFHNTKIPVSENLTLISGENECGKSTILDAIKYAYTGDTQFNKATNGYSTGVGRRNLISYTRCLIDASAGIYARPAEKIPVVYTHIALEYYDQINENPFILGVIIETAITDIRGTYWYAIDKKGLDDISFVYEEKSVMKPYDASGFQKKYGVQLKNKKEGITLFMQMTGLKIPYREVSKYQRKLRNIMAYNPAAKIQEFIKESVLEQHDINFDKLKEAKRNIEQINQSLEQINQELQDLDSILKDYDEHDKKALRIKIDDIKLIYKDFIRLQTEICETKEVIEKNNITCTVLEKTIIEQTREIDEIEGNYTEAKAALREMDVSKAIIASEQLIKKYSEQLKSLEAKKNELEIFKREMQKVIGQLDELGAEISDADSNMVEKLTAKDVEYAIKTQFIEKLKEAIRVCRDKLIAKKERLESDLSVIQEQCIEQNNIIENCNKSKANYIYVQEQVKLIHEINQEFSKRGICEEARMACEYVIELKDEEWRDAIEAFVGIHRYAILVSPAFFDIANEVLDHSKYKYVELINTKRLMSRKMNCEPDSIFHYLHIQNEVAAHYFKFWLGKIHAVDRENVSNFDNAMSKEGKLSRNMAVTYINTKKIKSYCLGNEAIELNKNFAEKKLRGLEERERELLLEKSNINVQSEYLKKALDYFREYHLDAHKEAEKVAKDLYDEKERYKKLIKAQKNNAQFMALNERVTELGKQLEEKKVSKGKNTEKKVTLEFETKAKEKDKNNLQRKKEEVERRLEAERISYNAEVNMAIQEYEAYLSGENKNGDSMKYETKMRVDRRVRQLEGEIHGKQQAYNNRKQEIDRLPIGLEHEAEYQKRRGKIWIDDLQGIQQKLKEQTVTYEKIFKREFVLNIYEMAKDAKNDISDINKELRKLQFATKYQFDVKLLSNHSDYAKILRYAQYLKESNNISDYISDDTLNSAVDAQMTLENFSSFSVYEEARYETEKEADKREEEIRDIINRIIDKNDISEINKFADYRNYMSYEIIINNDEVKDGKLSKQVGYNSGAGTQIPYTLILSAALSMLYNSRVNSVRLLFIDEPFEKMSDHNIKLMLEFFKNQNFQVIFCAPPNKLESIGSECGVIIPVLKISNDNMQIGKVKFHE